MNAFFQSVIYVMIVWVACPICIRILKRVNPDDYQWYKTYAIVIALLFTGFVIYRFLI